MDKSNHYEIDQDGNEVVLEETVSQFGLHRLHVMRMGEAVDMEKWIEEKVLPVGGMVETFYCYQEKELGMWHLKLYWRENEKQDVAEEMQDIETQETQNFASVQGGER